ncbi:MAG TPA: ferrous iron transporter B [Steroidobacteraceae bacterium]|jgi:ferrous iron transport protein B|nr:ferrous iron transporter B [Steroidobacteraceae bacterium]
MTRTLPDVVMRRFALVGAPNCGKTALFNRLTGSRQKVANYAGVTVERKEGAFVGTGGRLLYRVIDLPGAYSLVPTTLDEAITRDVVTGRLQGEAPPEAIVCVLDATNLRLSLRLALELTRLGLPMIVALNMSDLAHRRGFTLDPAALSRELGVAVVETVAVRPGGDAALLAALDALQLSAPPSSPPSPSPPLQPAFSTAPSHAQLEATQREVRRILCVACYVEPLRDRALSRLDAIVMHPVAGPALLAVLLFLIFQAVFSWAQAPMDWISAGFDAAGNALQGVMSAGPLRSLLVNGVIAGAGSVIAFLPQILILFFFILLLEDSGYLPRAAFLLDRLMGGVGLSGRSFIPLLSSFSCAIPGIMATRTIPNLRDRLATILLAPMMTCSARLPVYALIIGAFIPIRSVGPFNLQGLVLFALYAVGVAGALLVALIMKRVSMRSNYHPLMMELPEYHWPTLRNLLTGLWERAQIFITRVGTIILALMVLLWFLGSYPAAPAGAAGPAIRYSIAGMAGLGLQHLFAPLGFNWQISVALVPGFAAREVVVAALGTVYSLTGTGGGQIETALRPMIAGSWSLATALSLLAWYVFAPQCLSTVVTVRRETNSWRYPAIMVAYLFVLSYVFAFATYHIALACGAGA